jgi:hypothetical protein
MTSVRTTQTSPLRFRFFTVPFSLIIDLAHEKLNACAQTPIGSASSDETSLSVPLAVTIPTRGMPATPTHVSSRSVSAVGEFRNCGLRTTTVYHQIYYLEDFWYPLEPSGDQATLQLTNQRKNAQATIWPQSLSLTKVLS